MKGWVLRLRQFVSYALLVSAVTVPEAEALPGPVTTVFVSRHNGDVLQVTLSDGAYTVVGSTGVGSADSLIFDTTGAVLVSGNTSPSVFSIDPTLPGGSANTGTLINTTPLPGPWAGDLAIDSTGTKLYVADWTGTTSTWWT